MFIAWNVTKQLKNRKNEIFPFATTWLELEIIMPNEISQAPKEKDKYFMISLKMWNPVLKTPGVGHACNSST